MNEVLILLKNAYDLVNNSINLEPIIGLDIGLFEFFIGVFVLFTICSVILGGLLGKVVDYVNTPTEEEKFYDDVNKERYKRSVKAFARRREKKGD